VSLYLAAAATGALALIWATFVRRLPVPTVERGTEKTSRRSWMRLITDRNLLFLTTAYAAVGYFEYIFFYWIYFYFGEIRHTGFAQSARYTTIIFLVMLVMMPFGGWISDRATQHFGSRVGRRLVPAAALVIAAVLLYLGVTAVTTNRSTILLALAVGFVSFTEGPFWTMAVFTGGSQAGAAAGIMNGGGNVGGFLSPVVTPFLAKYFGWTWGICAGA